MTCATEILKTSDDSNLISQRADGYFYILQEVSKYIAESPKLTDQMNELAKLLLERLGSAFKSSTGANPSLCITDKDMIKKMNIRHHLTLFTNINGVQDLMKFFATCKLAFQSSVIAGEPNYLRWKDVLKIIREWRISLTDFVGQYVQYKESFVQFPLDASAFVYLMQVRLELEYSRLSSFEVVRDMMTKLKLEYDSFYREYQTLFGQHVQRKVYDESGIASFLIMLRSNDTQFDTYLQIYASNTLCFDLWNMFLYFSKENELNDIMVYHLALKLRQRIRPLPMTQFKTCCDIAKHSVPKIKRVNRVRAARIIQEIFHEFLSKEIYCGSYISLLDEGQAKEFLHVLLTLSWSVDSKSASCLFVLEHLIFTLYGHSSDRFEKLKCLFQRLNELHDAICVKNKPEKIIKDQWLIDYFYNTPYDLVKVNRDNYQSLCDIHKNNSWSLYIWSKFTYLSISNLDIKSSDEILMLFNQWLVEVEHDKYQDNDPLTTIFVNCIFECIISKQSKSVLSLPDIKPIIRYILHARDAESRWINKEKVDEFVETVQQSIRAVLLLEGESIWSFLYFNCFTVTSSHC
ncbi:unnamed protein product [Rotaria magnacalcarata]|uniref:Uncharacterized protein n=1 Tax=Rotaria magnacalcarata TaxID=392030 RepID=A0A816YM16_9BILA|nr:unnamed protein product [Rotaria magnacalcarata]CAF2162222.1 unnamed protein product [Rotaria magnacalcarata]